LIASTDGQSFPRFETFCKKILEKVLAAARIALEEPWPIMEKMNQKRIPLPGFVTLLFFPIGSSWGYRIYWIE
jgi:hypothetical protein